jgi:hypothetical protein
MRNQIRSYRSKGVPLVKGVCSIARWSKAASFEFAKGDRRRA